MSLLLVHDSTNSKVKALECDANGLLKVDKVDVSSLATDATLASMNAKITNCDTSSMSGIVSVSAVAGDVACTHASLPLPVGAATESSLSAMNAKITACDTSSISGNVACTHSSLPLPAGASTSANQATGNASLATLAGCVSANQIAVSSSASALSVTDHYLWGDASGSESVLNELDAYSDSVDVSTYDKISVYGSTSNLSDELEFQVSHDNSNWFEMTSVFVQVDYSSGHFGLVSEAPFSYVRLKKKGTGSVGASDNLWAILSGKK